MTVVRTVADLRALLESRRATGHSIGFVPTMGALHAGHLELVHRASVDNDIVVVSVFVNPTQFNDPADLQAYPRSEQRDVELATGAGADVVFIPGADEVYPPSFTATVALAGPIVDNFEGAHRGAAHFAGVTTVVTKLLNMVGPHRAYFGQKDAQQLRVVRAMVSDLNLDVKIVDVPTVREPDGLALSSRNVRLSPAERAYALGLSRAIFAGKAAFGSGAREATVILAAARTVLDEFAVHPEYLAVVDSDTFFPLARVDQDGAVLVVAAQIGRTRLIDNVMLEASQQDGPQ